MSAILCPGIPTIIDDKDQKPIVHYLALIDAESGKLVCEQAGCKFCYRTKEGLDVWCSDYMPATLPS